MPAYGTVTPTLLRPLPLAAVVVVLGLTAAAYAFDLRHTPVYFGGDEAHFAIQGHSIATTGGDSNGTVFPLFVNLWDPLGDTQVQEQYRAWYQPALFYVIAVTLKVLPLDEVSVRLPTALIGGLLSPLLLYAVAMRILKSRLLALVAVLVLALSPAHLLLSRQALDYILPIPFLLGWLWCLVTYIERGHLGLAFAGGLLLGVGFYSYIAAWFFMPACLLVSWLTYYRTGREARRASIAAAVGFALPLGLLVPWWFAHPEMLRETIGRYLVRDVEGMTLRQGASRFFGLTGIERVLSIYVGYFDPIFLFVRGGASMTTSTNRSGVLLLPVAPLLIAGIYDLGKRLRHDPLAAVLIGGLLLAPIPAALVGEGAMIQREVFMLPFAAMISGFGAAQLLAHRQRVVRRVVVIVLAAMTLQFVYVYRDYFTHYKLRSAFYYDPVVFGEVADSLLSIAGSSDVPVIYLSHDLDDPAPKWRFYSTKFHRADLLDRTRYVDVDGAELADAPVGSLLVAYPGSAKGAGLLGAERWVVVKEIADVDRRPASVVLRKAR